MQEQTKQNLTDRNIWARGAYMLFFVIAHAVAETLWVLIAIVQFLFALITGTINPALHRFGGNVARYVFQITQFQTFNSELTPYPFADWPDDDNGLSPWSGDDASDAEYDAQALPAAAQAPQPAPDSDSDSDSEADRDAQTDAANSTDDTAKNESADSDTPKR